MKALQIVYIFVFLTFLAFSPAICPGQDEIEKISLDPNKQITKGNHQIPSPKAQKRNLTAKANSEEAKPILSRSRFSILKKAQKKKRAIKLPLRTAKIL